MRDGTRKLKLLGKNHPIKMQLSHYFLTRNYEVIEEEGGINQVTNIPTILFVDNNYFAKLQSMLKDQHKSINTNNPLFIINITSHNGRELFINNEISNPIMEIRLDLNIFNKKSWQNDVSHTTTTIGKMIENYLYNPPNRNYIIEEINMHDFKKTKIGVVGLGYVGLPVAVGFASKYDVIGFDINTNKIKQLKNAVDPTSQFSKKELIEAGIEFVTDEQKLQECSHIIVSVPTPITPAKQPDLSNLKDASKIIGNNLTPNTIIIYESTVYPGTTEDICIPILENCSGLHAGLDFHVGYSPERINPGDKQNTFKTIPKVISGQDEYTKKEISKLYQSILAAKVYEAPSIKVAEAAKVIENTQRDINIAFMNELAIIFNALNIDTYEVIEAAKTKWNFIPMSPGLVGGHCIGVDPYYLIHKAKIAGYDADFISAARKINDSMPDFIVQQLLHLLVSKKLNIKNVCITVLGITFKENVADLRNSKALEIVQRLQQLGIATQVSDPYVNKTEVEKNNIQLKELDELKKADIVLLAVPHNQFKNLTKNELTALFKEGKGILMDPKAAIPEQMLAENIITWRL